VPGVCCVAVQPLGDVPAEQVDAVAVALREMYGFEVRVLEPVELPQYAWYEPRQRYRAELLNDFLRERVPEGCDRIAGLTTKDISTTKGDIEDWGILGLADMPGPTCVFSYYRCRRKVHEVPPLERLRRVAIHEVGHTLGLPHCPTYGCLLEDAGGKAETIDRETFLCDVCRERLGWIE
jgi:archaemetzincin